MTKVTLEAIDSIENPKRQIDEWGSRLVGSYKLKVAYDDELIEFVWVMATSGSGKFVPEYDDDFDDFLVKVCGGDSFSKCKKFINDIQSAFSLAVHYVHSSDLSIEVEFPVVLIR